MFTKTESKLGSFYFVNLIRDYSGFELNTIQKAIFIILATYTDKDGILEIPESKVLIENCRCGRSTLFECLKLLKDYNFIISMTDTSNKSKKYFINSEKLSLSGRVDKYQKYPHTSPATGLSDFQAVQVMDKKVQGLDSGVQVADCKHENSPGGGLTPYNHNDQDILNDHDQEILNNIDFVNELISRGVWETFIRKALTKTRMHDLYTCWSDIKQNKSIRNPGRYFVKTIQKNYGVEKKQESETESNQLSTPIPPNLRELISKSLSNLTPPYLRQN